MPFMTGGMPASPSVPSFGRGTGVSSALGNSSNRQLPKPTGPVMGPGAKMPVNTLQRRGGGFQGLMNRAGGMGSSGKPGSIRMPGEGADKAPGSFRTAPVTQVPQLT